MADYFARRRADLDRRILCALADEASLWEISRKVSGRTARIVRAVWRLETAGLLTARWVDQGPNRPRRRLYRAARR